MRFFVALLVSAFYAVTALGSAQAEILIKIDKSSQRMTVSRDGEVLYTWPVSTGRIGHATPSGSYSAFRMEADHYSKEWDDAPMPNSIFFTKTGHAIHGTYDTKRLGMPASHGCVRLSPAHATTLFAIVKQEGVTDTKVVLIGSEQIALARHGTEVRQGDTLAPGYAIPNAEYRQHQNIQPQYVAPDYRQSYALQPLYYQPLPIHPSYGFGALR
jgi:L,D-transpeptidase catalytic domain